MPTALDDSDAPAAAATATATAPNSSSKDNNDNEKEDVSAVAADKDSKAEAADKDGTTVQELTQAITKLSVQPEEKDAAELNKQEEVSAAPATKEEEEDEWAKASPSLQALAKWIRDGTCRRILVLTGAGVSVAAGIPDFRSKGTGLYDNLQKYNLPYPEAVFDVAFYRHNPMPFVSLAREIWPGFKHQPTLTHSFVTLLEKKGLLLRNYSQNIDGLEYLAGLNPDYLVECHGHFRSASCIKCKSPADIQHVRDSMVQEGKVTTCSFCKSFVKPDIVFFGEGLPSKFHSCLSKDQHKADLVLVLGTSLQVAPVSHIPEMVGRRCKRALVNRDLVGEFAYTCRAKEEDENVNTKQRDVFVAGDCDDTILQLARLLGWQDELQVLHREVAASSMKEKKNKPKKNAHSKE